MVNYVDNSTNVLTRIPNDLLNEIDKLAVENGLARNSQIIIILREYFKQDKALGVMSDILAEIKKENKQKRLANSKKSSK